MKLWSTTLLSRENMNYKDTLNLPHNSFPMKANLPQQEPKWLEGMGKTVVLRNSINKMHNGKYFQLFSGSPYSNGDIHVGHSFNYIFWYDTITK